MYYYQDDKGNVWEVNYKNFWIDQKLNSLVFEGRNLTNNEEFKFVSIKYLKEKCKRISKKEVEKNQKIN
jgi:hypothetical protein